MSWWWIVVTSVLALLAAALGLLVGRQQSAERIGRLREELAAARAQGLDERMVQVLRSVSGQAMAEQSHHLLDLAATRYQTLEQASELNWRAQGEAVVSRLEEYAARLTQLETQRQRESAVLHDAVVGLRAAHDELRDETRGLAGALNDRAVRGTWGEVQLRRVLNRPAWWPTPTSQSSDRTATPMVSVVPTWWCGCPTTGSSWWTPRPRSTRSSVPRAVRTRPLAARRWSATQRRSPAMSRRCPGVTTSVSCPARSTSWSCSSRATHSSRRRSTCAPTCSTWPHVHDVILASPGTLLAFLRGVAAGWRERQVAEEAAAVAALGRELHERVGPLRRALRRRRLGVDPRGGQLQPGARVARTAAVGHGAQVRTARSRSHKELDVAEQLVDLPLLMSAPELTVGVGDRDEVA